MTKNIRVSIFLILVILMAEANVRAEGVSSSSQSFNSSLESLLKQGEDKGMAGSARQKNAPSGACSGSPIDGMEVHVLGAVNSPGTFWVLPGTRVDEAIACAGDVTKIGTIRQIVLKHAGSTGEKLIDLFSYRYRGNLDENPYLSNQDVVFVPLYINRIRVVGAVKRPDIYEVLPKEATIKGVIAMAGGLTLLANLPTAVTLLHPTVSALNKDPVKFEKTEFTILEIETGKNQLSNGDIVIANDAKNRNVKFDFSTLQIPGQNNDLPTGFDKVFVSGDVSRSGPYAFRDFYTQNDYAYEAGMTKTSHIKKLKVITHGGTFRSKGEPIAPGDIIYVPSKTLTLSNTLQIWNVTTSTFFTGFSIYTIFNNN